MRPLVEFSLRQPVFLNVAFFGLVIYGATVALPALPVDRYPNFSFGEVQVVTLFPGADPHEVERLVTRVVEEGIRGMPLVEWVSSVSVFGKSEVFVKFEDDEDYDALFDELRLRVLAVQNQLPVVDGDPLQPSFNEIDTDAWLPVVQFNLTSPQAPAASSNGAGGAVTGLDRRALVILAKQLRARLERLPGVKRVDLMGDERQQYDVSLRPAALERHGVAFRDVVEAMRASGHILPAGTIDAETGERSLRVDTRYRLPEDVSAVIVRREGDGTYLRVADLIDPPSTGVVNTPGSVVHSVDGRDSVACKVMKESRANALEIRRLAVETVDEFLEEHAGMPVEVVRTLDSTVKIHDSMAVLHDSFLLAIALVIATLYFFLARRSSAGAWLGAGLASIAVVVVAMSRAGWLETLALGALALFVFVTCRGAILTVSGIVFSFLGTLVIFQVSGQGINEISLLGFVLVCGVIVDDAIIVYENIRRRCEEGLPLERAVIEGTTQVFWPVVSATATTCAAFLPMLLMTGSTGDFFAILPISIAIALSISLVECLVILPLHTVDLGRLLGPERIDAAPPNEGVEARRVCRSPGRGRRVYENVLGWCLAHGNGSIALVVVLFLCAIGVVAQSWVGPLYGQRPLLVLSFFPEDTSIFNATLRMPPGSSTARTDRALRELAVELVAYGPRTISSCSGLAGMSIDAAYRPVWSHRLGFVLVELPPREARDFEEPTALLRRLRQEVVPRFAERGIQVQITAQKDGPPTGPPVSIRVSGSDEASIERLTRDLFAWLQRQAQVGGELEGVIDLAHELQRREERVSFVPDLAETAGVGLTPLEVAHFVAGAFDGLYVGDYSRPDDDIPVRVRISRNAIADPLDLLGVPIIDDPSGRIVRFADLGSLRADGGGAELHRRNYRRSVTISGNLAEAARLAPTHVNRLVARWYRERARSYPGANVEFGGEAEHTAKSFRSLFEAFGLALFLIYLILATQFRSYLQPLIILSNVIFSFTGVILVMAVISLGVDFLPVGSLRPERSLLTIMSFIAVVGLTGIVVNDAIVLIDFVNQRRAAGLALGRALRLAGHQRMRPILMTTITTVSGLLPMAIGIPHFSISWSPFATCFVAGLTVSTSMTLLVVPVLYRQLEAGRIARRRRRRFGPGADSTAR